MLRAVVPLTIDASIPVESWRSFRRLIEWDSDLPRDLVERMWSDPGTLLAEGEKLQEKLRCTVARIEHPAGQFTWKHHNWGTLGRTLRKSFSQSPAKKSWLECRYLQAAGIPTPRTRAYVDQRFGPFKRCSFLLTDYIAGTSLYRLLRFEQPKQEFLEDLAQQVAKIWQQLDELGVWHNDFKTENLLVDRAGKVWLIDFERMRHIPDRHYLRERQMKDARDFLHPRNYRSDPRVAELFREAILATPAAQSTLAGPLGVAHPLSRETHSINRPNQLVTVLITCRNAADTIVGCLASVRDMADEILVANAGSNDETLQLVRQFGGCRIIESVLRNRGAGGAAEDITDMGVEDAAFESWAASHAQHDWILRLRPEEQLHGELSRQVQDLLASEPTLEGYQIGRTACFRGKWLRFDPFQSGPSIRLYRKQAASYEMRGGRVEVCIPSGNIGRLKSQLVFEACPNLQHCLKNLASSAKRDAEIAYEQGSLASQKALLWRPIAQFLKSFLLRGGYFDGWAGLDATILSAFAIYLREATLRDLERPAIQQTSIVHDRWKPLKVFVPSEPNPAMSSEETCSVRSAA